MNWDEAEEDASQRFASNLVPRQSPTKEEEELLSSKIEARRLLMKLNGALDELRDHMDYGKEREEEEEDDDEDSEAGERKYASETTNRNKNRTDTGGRRLGGRNLHNSNSNNRLEQKIRPRQREDITPQRKKNGKKNLAATRPEWNERYQANDSPFDYEAPEYKKGYHPVQI